MPKTNGVTGVCGHCWSLLAATVPGVVVGGSGLELDCFECKAKVEGPDLAGLGDAFLAHAESQHDWPYPDQAVRNYAEATQRLTGPSQRLPAIGEITIHPVTEDRLDDWMRFFDHDAFVGKPEWAACYCLEPHRYPSDNVELPDVLPWRENRAAMADRLRHGGAFGYLAYVDGSPAGWVNASIRVDYGDHFRSVDPSGPDPEEVIGITCFVIAPPYRRHGVAAALLDRVIADASGRGVSWVEAYPFNQPDQTDAGYFRGLRSMYQERGFEQVEVRSRDTVVRRRVTA